MSATAGSFELSLDRILASRSDPVVPTDLPRRIVVRSANLPQFSSTALVKVQIPSDTLAAPRRDRRRYWLGGALAASLAVVAIASGILMPSAVKFTDATRASAFVSSHIAIEDGADLPSQRPRSTADASLLAPTSAKDARKITARDHRPARAIYVADIDSGSHRFPVVSAFRTEPASQAALGTQPAGGETPRGSAPSRITSGTNEFSLASNEMAPKKVYGPVLDSERKPQYQTPLPLSGSPTVGPALGFASTASGGNATASPGMASGR